MIIYFSYAEIPDGAQLGEEYLLRVRVTEIKEEMVEVTSFGDQEPKVLGGTRSATVAWLATRKIDAW